MLARGIQAGRLILRNAATGEKYIWNRGIRCASDSNLLADASLCLLMLIKQIELVRLIRHSHQTQYGVIHKLPTSNGATMDAYRCALAGKAV